MTLLRPEQVDDLLRAPYSYSQRPRPVPADGRPLWRVPYVLLLVRACRQEVASLEQLHVLNWALRSSDGVAQLTRFLAGDLGREEPVVRYEPALDRAVALAGGLGLLVFEKKLWRLTDRGRALLDEIGKDSRLFNAERELLSVIGKPLPQAAVSRLLKREVVA